MSLDTTTGKFTSKLDLAMGSAIASAASPNIADATGNTIIITGTTGITSFTAASQSGVTRRLIFNGACLLTHSADLVLFGTDNITTVAGDILVFMAKTTTIWQLVSFHRPTAVVNGLITSDGIADSAIIAAKLGDACVIPSKQLIKEEIAMADSDSLFTAFQMIFQGIFTSVNTSNRARTTALASNIILALEDYQIGTAFDFNVIANAAFNDTIIANTGVTLVGSMVVNNKSAVFTCVVTSPTTVTIYRKS